MEEREDGEGKEVGGREGERKEREGREERREEEGRKDRGELFVRPNTTKH